MVYDNLIIRARSVTKSYGTEKVVSDFNLDVWNGAIVGILGVSGSGKTTALRLIAGFEKPDSGIIEMRNEIISNEEIYLNPVSQTVANSVGDPIILKGFSINGMVETSLGTFVSAYDGALDVSIRPECIELNLDTQGNYVVKECTFYGHDQVISFQNSKGEVFRARSLPNTIYEAGDKINIEISEVTTFPSKT